MNNLDKEINSLIMKEIGLEVGPYNKVVDQDTGVRIKIGGKDILSPGSKSSSQALEFDPYNNKKLMSQIFGYFTGKQEDETGVGVLAVYQQDDGKMSCRLDDNTVLSSESYQRDSLKYTDLIMQLNGATRDEISLSQYDGYPDSKNIKKKKGSKSK